MATPTPTSTDKNWFAKLWELIKRKILEAIENAGIGATVFDKLEEVDNAIEKLAENEVLSAEALEKLCEIVTSVNDQMHCLTQENVKEFQEQVAKQLEAVKLIKDVPPSQSLQEEVAKQLEAKGITLTQEQFDKAELYHEKGSSSFYLVIEDNAVKINCSFKKDENDPSVSIPVYQVINPDLKADKVEVADIKASCEADERTFHEPQKEGDKRFEKISLMEKGSGMQDKFSYTMTLLNAEEQGKKVLTTTEEVEKAKKEAEKSVIDKIEDPAVKYLLTAKEMQENGKYEVKFFDKDNTFAIRNKETGTLITGHVVANGSKIEFEAQEGVAMSLADTDSIVDLRQNGLGEVRKFCNMEYSKENGLKSHMDNHGLSREAVQMFHNADINMFLQANGIKQESIDNLINDDKKIYGEPSAVDEKYMFRVQKMQENINKTLALRDKYHGLSVELSKGKGRNGNTYLTIKSPETNENLRVSFNENGVAQTISYTDDKSKGLFKNIYSVDKNATTVRFDTMQKGKLFDDLFMIAFDNCEHKQAGKTMENEIQQVQQSKPQEKERPVADTNSEKFINVYFQTPEYAKATADILKDINSFMEKADKLQIEIQAKKDELAKIEAEGRKQREVANNKDLAKDDPQRVMAKQLVKTSIQQYRNEKKVLDSLEAKYDSLVKSSPYGIKHLQTYSKMGTEELEKAEPYFKELHKVYSAFTAIDLSTATPENRDTMEKAKMEALFAYVDFVKEYPTPEKYYAENPPEIEQETPAPTVVEEEAPPREPQDENVPPEVSENPDYDYGNPYDKPAEYTTEQLEFLKGMEAEDNNRPLVEPSPEELEAMDNNYAELNELAEMEQ